MTLAARIACAFLVALCALAPPPAARAQQDGIMTAPGDPVAAAAQAKARATLPQFLTALSERSAERYAVRIAVSHAEGRDHIWLDEVRIAGENFTGRIENPPRPVTGKRQGEAMSVKQSEITDWYLVRDGLTHGAWSIRAMLDRFPKEEAERMRKLLAPD